MKRFTLHSSRAAGLMMLGYVILMMLFEMVSCSLDAAETLPEDSSQQGDSVEVSFHLDGIEQGWLPSDSAATRSTWDDQTFPDGASIGIFVVDQSGTTVKSNVSYTYSSSTKTFKATSSSNAIYVGAKSQYSYYAYSPYKSGVTLTSGTFSLYVQTTTTTMKTCDILRAATTSVATGATSIGLTFRHMMALLAIDFGYHVTGLGYTEVAHNGLKLKYCNSGYTVNIKEGTIAAASSTVSTITQRGVTVNNVRYVVVDPFQSYSSGESLGAIRFTDSSGNTVDETVKLNGALSVASGSKCSVQMQAQTTGATTDWAYKSMDLTTSGSLDACASGTITYTPTITESRTVQDYLNGVASGSTYTQTRTFQPSSVTLSRYSGYNVFTFTSADGSAILGNSSENLTATAKKGYFNMRYVNPDGTQKTVTTILNATQPANTFTGGVTTWDTSSAAASASVTSFPSTLSTATLSYTAPTYAKSARVTGCGTVTVAASSGSATVSWSVGAWDTDASATKASISGSTLTVPANTGAARSATVTATFSDGTVKTFTITQAALTHDVDVD